MRTSKKLELIRTALDIVDREGLGALTYDSLAAASGVTKSGLIYHFPSRQALLTELNKYVAACWDARLRELAGGDVSEVSLAQRLRALVQVHAEFSTRAALLLALDAMEDPELCGMWNGAVGQWLIPNEAAGDAAFLVQLAMNGLWMHDYISEHSLSAAQREAAVAMLLRLIDERIGDEKQR